MLQPKPKNQLVSQQKGYHKLGVEIAQQRRSTMSSAFSNEKKKKLSDLRLKGVLANPNTTANSVEKVQQIDVQKLQQRHKEGTVERPPNQI